MFPEKHSHNGPIISVQYFSNVKKKYISSQNLLIDVYVWKDGYDIELYVYCPIFQCCVQEAVYNCHDL